MFEAHAQGTEPDPTPDTLGKAVQRDPGIILDKNQPWVDVFQRLLPNLVVALVVLLLFVGLGWGVQRGIRRWRRGTTARTSARCRHFS